MWGNRTGRVARWARADAVLGLCIGAYLATRFSQVIVGPLVPLIRGEFAVSRGAIGTALTGMWVAYALLQLPSGVLGDRLGERRVVLVALGTTTGAAFGVAVAPTFLAFAVALVGLGVGAGVYYNPATALLTREADEIGGAIGTHRVGGQVAGVVAPVVAATVGVRYGWRPAVGVGALLAVVAGGLFFRSRSPSGPASPETSLRALLDPRDLLNLLTRPHARNTTFLMTLVEFVGLAAMAFLPTFLVERHGFSVQRANLLFTVFFGVSTLCQPLGGWLSDWIGRDATVAVQSMAGAIGYGALVAGGASVVVVPAVVLAGVATSGTPVLQSRMMDGLTAATRGRGFGLFRTTYLLISATGTAVVGTTADVVGWNASFGLLAGLLCVVLLSLVVIGVRNRTRH
jgi:MFS family permease